MGDGTLKPEDYVEPRCVLCGDPYGAEPAIRAVPQQRIRAKLDEYMGRRDYAGAKRHLLYWLEEARLGRDLRGELMISNELIGHFRKAGERDEALRYAEAAMRLIGDLDYEGSLTAGTTYVNAATAYQAFGESEKAVPLFEKAKAVYEEYAKERPELLGGLYNNMALSLVSLKRFAEARACYEKAMDVMARAENGALEQAITCLNMADAAAAEKGPEEAEKEIDALTERAFALLDKPGIPRDGYYAFVCEKCAPSFSYYGYFMMAEELAKRAEEIYGRG